MSVKLTPEQKRMLLIRKKIQKHLSTQQHQVLELSVNDLASEPLQEIAEKVRGLRIDLEKIEASLKRIGKGFK